MTEEVVQDLIHQLVGAYDAGILLESNGTSSPPSWDVASSIFFAGTVVTTIGEKQKTLIHCCSNVGPGDFIEVAPSRPKTWNECRFNVGQPSLTVDQR